MSGLGHCVRCPSSWIRSPERRPTLRAAKEPTRAAERADSRCGTCRLALRNVPTRAGEVTDSRGLGQASAARRRSRRAAKCGRRRSCMAMRTSSRSWISRSSRPSGCPANSASRSGSSLRQHRPAQARLQLVAQLPDLGGVGARQQRTCARPQRLGRACPAAQRPPHRAEVGVDGRVEPVGPGPQHVGADEGAQPEDLAAHRGRVALVAVEQQGQPLGGQPVGVQRERGEQLGGPQRHRDRLAVEQHRRVARRGTAATGPGGAGRRWRVASRAADSPRRAARRPSRGRRRAARGRRPAAISTRPATRCTARRR